MHGPVRLEDWCGWIALCAEAGGCDSKGSHRETADNWMHHVMSREFFLSSNAASLVVSVYRVR